MTEVAGTVELGAFISRSWALSADPRHLVSIGADFAMDAASGHGGSWMSIRGNCFLPVGRALLLNLGVGRGWGSSKFTRAFYGVSDQDTGLFPSLVNQTYEPGKGWMDWRVNYGAIVHLSPSWHLVAGGRWQRLGSDLARSPVVAERGQRIQTIRAWESAMSGSERRLFARGVGFALLALASPAWAQRWVLLGQRSVRLLGDRDDIVVSGHKGTFRRIRLRVLNRGVEFTEVTVIFGNGERFEVPIRSFIPAGGQTRVIDLPGKERVIRRVMLVYRTRRGADARASVQLWGAT